MRLIHVAMLDGKRLSRSPGLWIAMVGCVFAIAGGVVLPGLFLSEVNAGVGLAFMLGPGTDLVVPIVALLTTYGAIAGQRERGSITILLGTPHRRIDVLGGILIARVVAVVGILMLAIATATLLILVMYGVPPIRRLLVFTVVAVLAVICYCSIGVAVSATVSSRNRAIAILLPGLLFAYGVWSPLLRGVETVVFESVPWWFDYAELVNPLAAFGTAAHEILPPTPHLAVAIDEGGLDAEAGAFVGGSATVSVIGFAIGVLLWWTIIPLLVARWRMGRVPLA